MNLFVTKSSPSILAPSSPHTPLHELELKTIETIKEIEKDTKIKMVLDPLGL
jgi:hypothetical protein